MASTKRENLIETARRLFYRDGFHRTGIDAILAEAGVAKMTLYKHFKSKDELILATLRLRDERFRNSFMKAVEQRAEKPADRLLAVFDVLEEWFRTDEFCGCLFINAYISETLVPLQNEIIASAVSANFGMTVAGFALLFAYRKTI